MASSDKDVEAVGSVAGETRRRSELRDSDDDDRKSFAEVVDDSTTASDQIIDEEAPIVYHYLTFETELPLPSSLGDEGAPPEPNLTPFMSPFLWSPRRKQSIVILSCIATMFTAYTAGAYAAPVDAMSAEWGVSSVAVLVGITTFCCGFATAPMILAPFSEINGRYPVFLVAGILFEVCQICCAVTHSYPGMLVARFWAGVGSSVFSTMVGGIISDLYHKEDRNTPMALFSGGALFGTGLGPLVSGFIVQRWHWRWVFWIQVITCGLLVASVGVFLRETRGSILLSRKAKALNKWYEQRESVGLVGFEMPVGDGEKIESQRIRWKVKSDEERESLRKMVGISVYRPFHLLTTEPVVFFFSLWVSFAWSVLYLTFDSIPLVFSASHNFTADQTGAVFAAMCVAAALATGASIYQESALVHLLAMHTRHYPNSTNRFLIFLKTPAPEGRLYFSCIESVLLPIGLFWFGWSQFSHIPWIWPVLSIGCSTLGIFSVYLATFNYLADTYHRYASSALAAQSFCRNMMGGIFPLLTAAMFRHMTFQGAASFLGGVGVILTAVPWVLVMYGPRIRARSKFAREIM